MESRHVIVDDIRAHYLSAGEGAPLVLLHGSAIDSSELSYGFSIPVFAQRYRVFAPDWPGYGKSERPWRFLTMPDYVAFLERFLDVLELQSAHLVGFSMGGGAALGFALKHPERVRKLVLVASYGLGGEVHVPLLPYLALKMPRLDMPVWLGLRRSKRLLRLFLMTVVFANPRLVTRELVEEIHRQVKIPDVERAFMAWIRGEVGWRGLTTNYLEELVGLRAPTLLLHGSRDLIVPASRSRRAATLIPDAHLEIIPRCGHWLPREAGERFQREVLEFLE